MEIPSGKTKAILMVNGEFHKKGETGYIDGYVVCSDGVLFCVFVSLSSGRIHAINHNYIKAYQDEG